MLSVAHPKGSRRGRLAQREARRPLWMDTWVMDGGGAQSHVDWKMLPEIRLSETQQEQKQM